MAASFYMSGTIEIVDSAGVKHTIPFEDTGPSTVTEVDPGKEFTVPVSGSGAIIIWQTTGTGEQITTFERMILIARDGDLDGELVVDLGGEVGTEYIPFFLKENVPYILPSAIALANFTTDVFAGTDDLIERVKVKNRSATVAAKCLMILVDDT